MAENPSRDSGDALLRIFRKATEVNAESSINLKSRAALGYHVNIINQNEKEDKGVERISKAISLEYQEI